jgi:hypothetical protein
VLPGSFQDELAFMRTRHRWPSTVREVAACLGDFSAELGQIADGVLGPSQWEPGVTFPNIAGPTADWFLDSFQTQFGRPPKYIAAGSFATGLVLTECIRQTACLDHGKLRNTAAGLDWNTFYGRFRIDSRTGIQTGTTCCSSGGKEAIKQCCLRVVSRAECMPTDFPRKAGASGESHRGPWVR